MINYWEAIKSVDDITLDDKIETPHEIKSEDDEATPAGNINDEAVDSESVINNNNKVTQGYYTDDSDEANENNTNGDEANVGETKGNDSKKWDNYKIKDKVIRIDGEIVDNNLIYLNKCYYDRPDIIIKRNIAKEQMLLVQILNKRLRKNRCVSTKYFLETLINFILDANL